MNEPNRPTPREHVSRLIDDKRYALKQLEIKLLEELTGYKKEGVAGLLEHKERLTREIENCIKQLWVSDIDNSYLEIEAPKSKPVDPEVDYPPTEWRQCGVSDDEDDEDEDEDEDDEDLTSKKRKKLRQRRKD
jgi:hypothetical protein